MRIPQTIVFLACAAAPVAQGATVVSTDEIFTGSIAQEGAGGGGAIGMNRFPNDGTVMNGNTCHRWQIGYNYSGQNFWQLEHYTGSGAGIGVPLMVDANNAVHLSNTLCQLDPSGVGAVGYNRNPYDGSSSNTAHQRWQVSFNVGVDSWRIEQYASNGSGLGIPFCINSAGNVGIGTQNPQSSLAVDGVITAKEVRVTLAGWSDNVLSPGYRLAPLEQVEKAIQAEHHLPNIPSEREVVSSGVQMGDMLNRHMAKIEELTLYAIAEHEHSLQLQASVEAMARDNQALRDEVEGMARRLAAIEATAGKK